MVASTPFNRLLVPFLAVLASCGSPFDPFHGSNSTPNNLLGPGWELVSFQNSSGTNLELGDRERYHLSFESDSTFSGVAHCNKIHEKYAAEQAGVIAISSIGTTFAYCGKHSRDIEYLGSLRQAQVYETTGNRLRLGFGETGLLVFRESI